MILRLREGHRELNISRLEAEKVVESITNGAEMILIRGWMIMKGDIAHIDPTGLSRDEIDEIEKNQTKRITEGRRSATESGIKIAKEHLQEKLQKAREKKATI